MKCEELFSIFPGLLKETLEELAERPASGDPYSGRAASAGPVREPGVPVEEGCEEGRDEGDPGLSVQLLPLRL